VLKQLQDIEPCLITAYLRNDNAGCYQGSDTLLAVEQIHEVSGVLACPVDFADAQFEEGPYKRMTSTTKANVRRFVNEKDDCITSFNFVEVLKATRFMTIMPCHLPDVSSEGTIR
jgi:hypothetical protein